MRPSADLWTAREIAQQPQVWRELAERLDADATTRAFCATLLRRPEVRVVLTGAGSSGFGGEILAPGLARALRRRVDAVATTDLVADPHGTLAEDVPTLLVSFARSGDSPESVAATDLADRLLGEVHHLIVTCNGDGALASAHADRPRSHVLVLPDATEDRGFAMTSSLTSMMLVVLLLHGRVDARGVGRLAAAVEDALPRLEAGAVDHAGRGAGARVVYLGSGALHGLARESALKLLELTAGRVAAWSDSSLGFRHGPKALLDDRTLAIVHVSNDPYTRAYDLDILAELAAALPPGNVVAVAAGRLDLEGVETWAFPSLADLPDEVAALAFVVTAQVLALEWSAALGHDPDDPFPAQEVNRVVQGVGIHCLP